MKRTYHFDTEIAPLTEEEKEIMLKCNQFINKRNKIYERTDKVIREYRKKQKAKEKALQKERQKELLKQLEEEKQKQLELQKLKELEFPANFNKLKKAFNEVINSINFYNNKEKIDELIKLQIDFRKYCIHPLNYKCESSYNDVDESGCGMLIYSTKSCDGCSLCKESYVSMRNFASEIDDTEMLDKLKHLKF